MTQRESLAAAGIAVALLLAPACGAQELVYQFNPELGVPYKVAQTNEVRTQTQFQGMDLDVTMTMRMEQDAVFEAGSEDDNVVGRYTFTSLSSEMSGMPGLDQMPFDINDIYQGMVGQTLTIVRSRSGELVEFSGLAEAMEAMMDELDLDGEMIAAISQAVESNLGGGQIRDTVQEGVPYVPQEPVDTGDSWNDSVTAFGLTVDSTYSLGERSNGTALIEVAAEIGEDDAAHLGIPGMPEIPGFEMSFENLSGEYTGTYELDEATGLAVSYNLDMSMSVDMSMAMPQAGGQAAGAPSISMSMQSRVQGTFRRAD